MSVAAFSAAMREAAVTLLKDYAQSVDLKLQVYPARPRSIHLPTAFVERMSESIEYTGPTYRQRTPRVDVMVLHGLYDGLEAVTQRDAFVDGFLDYVTDRVHAAGDDTTIAGVSVEDEPEYLSDWMPPGEQRVYFGTRITLEGYAGG